MDKEKDIKKARRKDRGKNRKKDNKLVCGRKLRRSVEGRAALQAGDGKVFENCGYTSPDLIVFFTSFAEHRGCF